jgi:hypothetical protein
MQRFAAEVLFLDPVDVPAATAALAAVGCKYTIDLDAIDPCGPTVFGMVVGERERAFRLAARDCLAARWRRR